METWGDCAPVSRLGDLVVMARQDALMATAFHPELSDDLRIHERFLSLL